MWHLEKLSEKNIRWFTETYLDVVYNSIHKSGNRLPTKVKTILTKEVINKLMVSEPETLYDYANSIEARIKAVSKKYDFVKILLYKLFDYEKNISKNKELSYELANRIGTKTCVYCNRVYAITAYVSEDKNGKPLKDEEGIVRPDFDHWLSKADHPLTSMSIYNLIPSCPICNRSIKNTKEFKQGIHIHPYTSTVEPTFKFHYTASKQGKWDLSIEGGTKEEKATAKILQTEALYKCHADMEVKDILDFLYSNTPEYLNDLFRKVLKAKAGTISPEEAYKILFGFESVPERFLERPLSKLKRDILDQASDSLGVKLL